MVFPRSGNLEGLMTTDDHDTVSEIFRLIESLIYVSVNQLFS